MNPGQRQQGALTTMDFARYKALGVHACVIAASARSWTR
jgi:hypothetical protein